jgi:hypothetical protein
VPRIGRALMTVAPSAWLKAFAALCPLPDSHSKLLFRMSSGFPTHLIKAAADKGYQVSNEARFFGYKAGYEGIVDFFDIGTRASNLR